MELFLDIPHVSQSGPQAPLANDCGQACITGEICGLTVYCPTVYELSVKSGFATGKFTTVANLISMGATAPYRLALWYTNRATLEWLDAALGLGISPTFLIDYRPLSAVNGIPYQYAHFVNVVGRRKGVPGKPDGYWINDPLQPSGPTFVTRDVFAACINTPSLTLSGTNNPNIAVYPTEAKAKIIMSQEFPVTGWNIDLVNNAPDPAIFGGPGRVRIVVDISGARGPNTHSNTDYAPFYDRIKPYLIKCKQYGIRPMLVVTHETLGEGRGYNWPQMKRDRARWFQWLGELLPFVEPVIRELDKITQGEADWVFFNQNDAPDFITDSIYIDPAIYGEMYREFHRTVKGVNPALKVLTAGFMGAANSVIDYLRTAGIMSLTDGYGWHPYEAGASTSPYLKKRNIEPDLNLFRTAFPGKQMYIQEFGGFEQASFDELTEYVLHFWRVTSTRGIPALFYPAVTGMHGRVGPLTGNHQIRFDSKGRSMIAIAQTIEAGTTTTPPPTTPPPPAAGVKYLRVKNVPSAGLKFRKGAGLGAVRWVESGQNVTVFENSEIEAVLGPIQTADGFDWLNVRMRGMDGWFAVNADGNTRRVFISL